jgi:hypothetical protein
VVCDLGLQAPVTGPIAKSRDQSDRTLLLVPTHQSAHLARRKSQSRGDCMLLEFSVDKSLNAFEPIQIAHRHCHLWYPDHVQYPRP